MIVPLILVILQTALAKDFFHEVEDFFEDLDFEDVVYIAIAVSVAIVVLIILKKTWKKCKKHRKHSEKVNSHAETKQPLLDKENKVTQGSSVSEQNYPPQGYPPNGYPPNAYPPNAYPPNAYPPNAYPPNPYAPAPPGYYQPYPVLPPRPN